MKAKSFICMQKSWAYIGGVISTYTIRTDRRTYSGRFLVSVKNQKSVSVKEINIRNNKGDYSQDFIKLVKALLSPFIMTTIIF